jgi:hypothetical protein
VNLAEFTEFLNLINSDSAAPARDSAAPVSDPTSTLPQNVATNGEGQYWKAVQASLIHSQWARLYRTRAVAVIAMLDPEYSDAPRQAEGTVRATLRPAVLRRQRGARIGSLQGVADARSSSRGHSRKASRKKKLRSRAG